jgi:hypothetical protein
MKIIPFRSIEIEDNRQILLRATLLQIPVHRVEYDINITGGSSLLTRITYTPSSTFFFNRGHKLSRDFIFHCANCFILLISLFTAFVRYDHGDNLKILV